MNTYAIYGNSQQKDNNFIIVKQGFSFAAAFFSTLWAIYHKMWSVIILSIVLHMLLGLLPINPLITIILIFGFFAADIQEYYLRNNKYQLIDIIIAPSLIHAELRFFERTSY